MEKDLLQEIDVIVHYMDDDIREFLCGELVEPHSEEEFLKMYHLCHDEVFGEKFIIN